MNSYILSNEILSTKELLNILSKMSYNKKYKSYMNCFNLIIFLLTIRYLQDLADFYMH